MRVDTFDNHKWRGQCYWHRWVDVKDAVKHFIVHRTAPQRKIYLVQNVNSAKAEEAWTKGIWPSPSFCAVLSHCHVQLSVTPWTVAWQALLSLGILQARTLEWVAMPSSRGLPNPRIEPRSPTLQVDSLPSEPPGKPSILAYPPYINMVIILTLSSIKSTF